ncbi:sterol desaturase family protein [Halobacteriovorax sp. XZX-3]|uniref:sterol desaturase family protein n=1 Tax=unclassified Halobacteriovorax TaxID=2639665 RepID=UPI00371A2642
MNNISANQIIILTIYLSTLYVIERRKIIDYNDEYKKEAKCSLIVMSGSLLTKFIGSPLLFLIASHIEKYKFFDFQMPALVRLILVFILVDFAYYVFHRTAHQVRLLWASHSVHHTPNVMQVTAALRLGWGAVIPGQIIFLSPLLLIGIRADEIFGILSLNLFYQYWLHTEVIRKLPNFIEYLFNTPSHHRVHHGRNDIYKNKNFGGILIIFDRLFGSFQKEEESIKIKYGRSVPIKSYNPFFVAFHEWISIYKDTTNYLTRKVKRISN